MLFGVGWTQNLCAAKAIFHFFIYWLLPISFIIEMFSQSSHDNY